MAVQENILNCPPLSLPDGKAGEVIADRRVKKIKNENSKNSHTELPVYHSYLFNDNIIRYYLILYNA